MQFVRGALLRPSATDGPIGPILLGGSRPVVAHPDDYLYGMIEQMTRANVAHIPVVSPEDGRLAGYLGWKDLINVRARLQAEERDRVVLYRVR